MIKEIISGAIKPVADIFVKREERKTQREALGAKLKQAKQDGVQEITLSEQEIEMVRTAGLEGTWKDEYVTLSLVSIVNFIVAGAILSAFGKPELLTGMSTALTTLTAAEIPIGDLITAAVLAGLGLSVWRRA